MEVSLDKLCQEIMKLVRDMADTRDIEQMVSDHLSTAFEAGYVQAENELGVD